MDRQQFAHDLIDYMGDFVHHYNMEGILHEIHMNFDSFGDVSNEELDEILKRHEMELIADLAKGDHQARITLFNDNAVTISQQCPEDYDFGDAELHEFFTPAEALEGFKGLSDEYVRKGWRCTNQSELDHGLRVRAVSVSA